MRGGRLREVPGRAIEHVVGAVECGEHVVAAALDGGREAGRASRVEIGGGDAGQACDRVRGCRLERAGAGGNDEVGEAEGAARFEDGGSAAEEGRSGLEMVPKRGGVSELVSSSR